MKCITRFAKRLAAPLEMRISGVALLAAAFFTPACTTTPDPPLDSKSQASEKIFTSSVKPLFESRCSWCHSNELPQGGLNFQDKDSLVSSPRKFLVPGAPDKSLIYLALSRPGKHPQVMPGDGWGITAEQKSAIRTWIESGAYWPQGKKGTIRRKPYSVDFDDYL